MAARPPHVAAPQVDGGCLRLCREPRWLPAGVDSQESHGGCGGPIESSGTEARSRCISFSPGGGCRSRVGPPVGGREPLPRRTHLAWYRPWRAAAVAPAQDKGDLGTCLRKVSAAPQRFPARFVLEIGGRVGSGPAWRRGTPQRGLPAGLTRG